MGFEAFADIYQTNLHPTLSANTLNKPSAADVLVVANTFDDLEKDACARWAIGVTMRWYEHYEDAVVECKEALELATDDLNRFRILGSLADLYRQQKKWEESYEWATQALQYRPAGGDKLSLMIREVLNMRAACETQLGRKDQAMVTIEESRSLVPGTIAVMSSDTLDSLTVMLAEQDKWEELMSRLENWTLWDRFSWLCLTMNGEERHDRFQQAAKKSGKVAFLVEAYGEIILYLETSYPQSAGIVRYQLAKAYHTVIHDNAKAKALLHKVLDADACVELVSGDESYSTLEDARFDLADILYEE